ncbi:hypothetical protein HDV03_004923 [Kappamyces sp. JEL0829]|nr:hypothetical protein HDV03_004923 [Kappamyces sp. JEL0829]
MKSFREILEVKRYNDYHQEKEQLQPFRIDPVEYPKEFLLKPKSVSFLLGKELNRNAVLPSIPATNPADPLEASKQNICPDPTPNIGQLLSTIPENGPFTPQSAADAGAGDSQPTGSDPLQNLGQPSVPAAETKGRESTLNNTIKLEEPQSADGDDTHSYISYSYMAAKKAHAKSAQLKEDRSTLIRRMLNQASLARSSLSSPWGDTHSFSARSKWKFVIGSVIKLVKSFSHFSGIYQYAAHPDADVLFQLFKFHQEVCLSTKIQHYFCRIKSLTEDELNRLNHLLSERIGIFSRLSYEQKVRLCQYTTYEKHKKGTKLFNQGGDSQFVYYILSGQIQLMAKSAEKEEMVTDYLNMGATINADNLEGSWQEHLLRSATAVCFADTELLCFDRRDYWKILKSEDTLADVEDRIRVLRSMSTFRYEDEALLEQTVPRTSLRYFPKDARIVTQGLSNTFLYWIISGSVRVDRLVSFVARAQNHRTIRPDTCNAHIRSGEHRIEEKLTIGELREDACFPEPMPESIRIVDDGFDRLELISKLADHDALGMNRSTVSATAICPTVCLAMQRIDFCRVMSMAMFKSLRNESSIYSIKAKPLQEEWVTKVDWEKEKRHVLQGILRSVKSNKKERDMAMQQWRNWYLQ